MCINNIIVCNRIVYSNSMVWVNLYCDIHQKALPNEYNHLNDIFYDNNNVHNV